MFNIDRPSRLRPAAGHGLRASSLALFTIPLLAAACGAPAESTDLPEQTRSEAAAIPIKLVVIIVKENHAFDNYFGAFPVATGTLGSSGDMCPSTTGSMVPCSRAPDKTSHDMSHGHDCGLVDWDGGKMDGWNHSGGSDTGDGLVY